MGRSSLKSVFNILDTVNNELSVDECFSNDFKRSMELDAIKGNRKPSQTYKPSSMNCIRNMYYQVVGQEPEIEDANYTFIGICNSGSDIHIRVQTVIDNMKNNGMECEYVDVAEFINQRNIKYVDVVSKVGVETKLKHTKLNMSFMCDGIIRYKNHYYILEIKTETTNKFWKRKSVDPGHYNQATAYSIALGLDEVMFMYVNRDIFEIKTYLFKVTDEMKTDLVGKIEECDSFVAINQPPMKPVDIDKKTCSYCGYRRQCSIDG